MGLLHHRLNMANQGIHVSGLGVAGVDDEIGVQGGDLRTTNAVTLQTQAFNQPPCFLRLGVAENTAAAGKLIGLGAGALVEIAAGASAELAGVSACLELVTR